jgi:vanillate O-demethylase ferredoxin subunit
MKLLMAVEVAARRMATAEIVHLTLRPAKRPAFPVFRGGAHTILQLPDGTRRPYSICSDPADASAWEIAVKREGAASAWLHDQAAPGTRLLATFPQNLFSVAEGEGRHVMIAGGIGVTPFLSMLPELERAGADFALHLLSRGADRAPFAAELRGRLGARLVLHDTAMAPRPDITALLAGARYAYACGPASLLDVFAEATRHWPEGRARVEHFSGLPAEAAHRGASFAVRIASTGAEYEVPEGRTLLEVLNERGHRVDHACRGGVCASCIVPVAAGEVEHRDMCLTRAQRAVSLAACVSRGRGTVTLGL